MKLTTEFIQAVIEARLTGSRVICNPPVMDTDIDIVCLMRLKDLSKIYGTMVCVGWTYNVYAPKPNMLDRNFRSLRRDEYNLICTQNEELYNRFCMATDKAKKLNLLNKKDRVALFERMLYNR